MTVFLALIIVAMVLGIIGATADGLFFPLIIGIAVLVVDVVYLVVRMRRVCGCEPRGRARPG